MKDKDTILLWEAYLTEGKQKDHNGDGKNDFEDVKIARRKASGRKGHDDEDEDEETVEEGGNHTGHDACAKGEYWCEKEKKCLPDVDGVEEDDQSYFRNTSGQDPETQARQEMEAEYGPYGRDGAEPTTNWATRWSHVVSDSQAVYGVYNNLEMAQQARADVGGGAYITKVPAGKPPPASEDQMWETL